MNDTKTVELDEKYYDGIRRGLDRAFKDASTQELDPSTDRIVIFSDLHKGLGDPADDYRRCEHAYTTALGYYLEAGYRLFLLGDVEELWEEHARPVIERYRDVLQLERQFVDRGNGLDRFWGNHDDQWASKGEVGKHLRDLIGTDNVREALRLKVGRAGAEPGTLFFVHGHQGTTESDRFRPVSRLFVRHVWRPIQRRTGFSATTPSRDYALRAKHDRAMYEWARTRKPGLVLIAGHTHRPVFARSVPEPPPTRPMAELEQVLEAASPAERPEIRAELEYARTAQRRPAAAFEVRPPCYFNTGCCSFPDGDVTGLEIADGEMRLVRWPANLREICRSGEGVESEKRILVAEELEKVLAAVAAPPERPVAVEREIAPA